MSLASYHDIIAASRGAFVPTGFNGDFDLPSSLFPHQRAAVEFSLRAGSSAMFLDTGLGKTRAALAWGQEVVSRTNKPVLMLAPLGVTRQHAKEAADVGIDAVVSREGGPQDAQIVIANYERLHLFNSADFAGIILDECFAADTPIDVVDQHGKHWQKHIKDIKIGDNIVNASGIDSVSDVHRREVPYAIRVRYSGKAVVASPNHPFFTRSGWKGAMDLVPGDEIVATAEAMRLVRRDVHDQVCSGREDAILRSILLSEMADAATGALGESSRSIGRGKARRQTVGMASQRRPKGGSADRPHRSAQPHVHGRGEAESLPPIERHEARTFRAWGEWAGANATAVGFDGCAARQLDGGVCFVVGSTDSRLSHALQARLSKRRKANSYRGGWSLTPFSRASGQKEGSEARRFRVEGIEVLELGHPDLDQYRDADGKLYFYDLGGTQHPSFSIHGALVHNSSILKSFTGQTTKRLIETFSRTPYRLACTATPAPNDHTELGTHAEFLSVMTRDQMLMRWFLHDSADTGTWRLKGHGVRPFWDWVASWARCVSKPSDLGFSDEGFEMPELRVHRHLVAADRMIGRGEEKDGQAHLFRMPDMSATSVHTEKRLTCEARAQLVADIVAAEPGEPWTVWVETDYDADAIMAVMPKDAVEVRGSMTAEQKEDRLTRFANGDIRVLVTKASIAGFGLNFQHCARTVFAGMSFSYEAFYQAVRRHWRFRQTRSVDCHVVFADTEAAIWDVVTRKAGDHNAMKREMTQAMARAHRAETRLHSYQPQKPATLPAWMAS